MKNYTSKHSAELSSKGFYTILTLCALIVAGSLYAIYASVQRREAASLAVEAAQSQLPISPTIPDLTEDTPVAAIEPAKEDAPAEQAASPADVETVYAPVFVRPVNGTVLTPFSGDELLFQPTLGDWRVHAGTDFATSDGETALAVTDGEVTAVDTDALYGTRVTIAHDADLVTITCGLREAGVKVGQSVTAGEAIGTCGGKIPAEETLAPHIHVEARRAGTPVDLLEILGETTDE